MSNAYLSKLRNVALDDVAMLLEKEKSYGDSWKCRGGVGAFMMLARKWDRLENVLENPPSEHVGPQVTSPKFSQYDVFGAVETDTNGLDTKDGVIDDIRDLRRYLMLVEAELIARRAIAVAKGFANTIESTRVLLDNSRPSEALGRPTPNEDDTPKANVLHPE